MSPRLRVVGTVLLCLAGVTTAYAEKVKVDRDFTHPSFGSQAPFVMSGGGEEWVEVANTTPSVSLRKSEPTPGLLTPGASLLFTGFTQVPALDGFIYKPPDTHHATGTGAGALGRIVHVTNSGLSIFDKAGALVAGPLDLDLFLTGLGATGLSPFGVANLGFDPKVIFDQHSGRFFIVILDGRTPGVRSNLQIATSTTSTPSTLTLAHWTVETSSALVTIGVNPCWFDYPGIGADATRLVITGNMFDAGSINRGTMIRVFDKASLTDNGAPAGEVFNDIVIDNTVITGSGSIQPAHTYGATLNGDFYLINRFGSTAYRQWQITGPGGAASLVPGSPTLSAWVAGAQFTATGAPQISDGLNTNPTIATLSARVQNAVYRGDGVWACLAADADADSRTEVVWFEIDANSTNSVVPGVLTTPAITQSGFIDGSTATDWTFMPSIAANGSGDAVINYSESNALKAVEMRVVARFTGDPLSTFQGPVVIAAGAGEYDDFGAAAASGERWGDYSGATVDPDDDETFWVSNEVCQTATTPLGDNARWGTRIAKLGMVVPVEVSRFSID